MKMHTGFITIKSVAPTTLPPRNFQSGMFGQPTSQFPSRLEDFDPLKEDAKPFSQQKFQLEIDDFVVEVQPTPESPAERLLQPIKLLTHIERREFPRVRPFQMLLLVVAAAAAESLWLMYCSYRR